MRHHGARVAGVGLVLALLAVAIVWAGALRWQRPHVRGDSPAMVDRWPDVRININSASEAELTLLPGIGPALAERIVRDRDANGPYESLDDLTRVLWIGPVIVERLSPHAVVAE